MTVTSRCDNCDKELKVAYDSWDNDPYLPRVIRFCSCSCVTDRIQELEAKLRDQDYPSKITYLP